ncbi:MAG: hypothetical protein AABZ53_14995 [Planctomycetota bacterium]
MTTTTSPQNPAILIPGPVDWGALPLVRCPLASAPAIERLALASKRGRMPGFRQGDPRGGIAFSAAVWGAPFDRELHGTIQEQGDAGIEIRFTSPLLLKMPIIFAVVIAFSIWPGVWLTDSLIPGSWGWPPTWMWYLPLTILPLFYYLPRTWNKSVQAAWASTHETIAAIAKELDASVEPVSSARA